jgi:hypothetical protein
MATKKHRLTVSLNDEQYSVLLSLNQSTGQAMSAFLVDVLDSALPVFQKMAKTFEDVKRMNDAQKKSFVDSLSTYQSELDPIAQDFIQTAMSALNASDNEAVSGVFLSAHSARENTPEDGHSPLTNRGVTPTTLNTPKPKPGKALKPTSTKQKNKKVWSKNHAI